MAPSKRAYRLGRRCLGPEAPDDLGARRDYSGRDEDESFHLKVSFETRSPALENRKPVPCCRWQQPSLSFQASHKLPRDVPQSLRFAQVPRLIADTSPRQKSRPP